MKKVFLGKFFLFLSILIFLIPVDGYGEDTQQQKTELLQQFQLIVTGLKCKSCIPDVRKALRNIPGVQDARITKYEKAGSDTVVEVIPGTVSGQQLISILEASGFRGKILSVGEPRKVIIKRESSFSFFGLFN